MRGIKRAQAHRKLSASQTKDVRVAFRKNSMRSQQWPGNFHGTFLGKFTGWIKTQREMFCHFLVNVERGGQNLSKLCQFPHLRLSYTPDTDATSMPFVTGKMSRKILSFQTLPALQLPYLDQIPVRGSFLGKGEEERVHFCVANDLFDGPAQNEC